MISMSAACIYIVLGCIFAQGYIIYSQKQKLKEEYIGMDGKEIRKLKIAGVEISNTVEVHVIVYEQELFTVIPVILGSRIENYQLGNWELCIKD